MKQLIFCSLLVLLTATAFAQQTPSSLQYTKDYYLKKYKTQKTVAWVLVGAGTVGLLGTLLSDAFTTGISLGQSKANYTAPYLISGAGIAGSIPLFVAASKNLKRALTASAFLKIEKTLIPQPLTKSQPYPAIAVRIPLQ